MVEASRHRRDRLVMRARLFVHLDGVAAVRITHVRPSAHQRGG